MMVGSLKSTTKLSRHSPLLIILSIFLIVESFLFLSHPFPLLWAEDDGVDYLLKATTGGLFHLDPDHGSGYPIVIRMFVLFGFTPFVAAKLISLICGVLLLVVAWFIFNEIAERRIAILATVILASTPVVMRNSIFIMSDMLTTFLFWAIVWIFIRPQGFNVAWAIVLGLLGGFVYITRSVFILSFFLPVIQFILSTDRRSYFSNNFRKVLYFYSFFFIAIFPWCLFLYIHTGNPFWSHRHLLVIFSEFYNCNSWNNYPYIDQYPSLMNAIRVDPLEFLGYALGNLISIPGRILSIVPTIWGFGVLGFFLCLQKIDSKKMFFLLTSLLYTIPLCLLYFDDRYYLPLAPLASICVAYGLDAIPEQFNLEKLPILNGPFTGALIKKIAVILSITILLNISLENIGGYFNEHSYEVEAAAQRIKELSKDKVTTVFAPKEYYALYSRSNYVDFRAPNIRLQFAKISQLPQLLFKIKPTYFVYDERYAAKNFPEFSLFLFPKLNPYPELLRPVFVVYRPYRVVVYEYKPAIK